MKVLGPLPCSTCRARLIQSTPLLTVSLKCFLILSSYLCQSSPTVFFFLSGFSTKTVCAFLTFPSHLNLLEFITRIIFVEDHKLWSSSLRYSVNIKFRIQGMLNVLIPLHEEEPVVMSRNQFCGQSGAVKVTEPARKCLACWFRGTELKYFKCLIFYSSLILWSSVD